MLWCISAGRTITSLRTLIHLITFYVAESFCKTILPAFGLAYHTDDDDDGVTVMVMVTATIAVYIGIVALANRPPYGPPCVLGALAPLGRVYVCMLCVCALC